LELNLTVKDNHKKHSVLRQEFDKSNALTTFDQNIAEHLAHKQPTMYSQLQEQLSKFTADQKTVEKKLQK
jgi:hypothetical protein